MYRYRCPSCKGQINIQRLYDGRHIINCKNCEICHVVKMNDTLDRVYLNFLEDYDEGIVKKKVNFEKILEISGLIRSESEINRMLNIFNLNINEVPEPVRKALLSKSDYIVTYKLFEEEEPKFGCDINELDINENIIKALKDYGIKRLYHFQEEAINCILNNENVVIVAPTGSGKTEAFAIPIIHKISKLIAKYNSLKHNYRTIHALFIYPTKALARDQLPKLKMLGDAVNVKIEIFDGDTPKDERQRIIDNPPDIILTNFDTLHSHLIYRTKFSSLLHNVNYIVVDEVHVYTGIFGANVHYIVKRLKRIVGNFQIIAASATISNPKEFCETLFDAKFRVVSGEKGKHGRIHFVMIFPTLHTHRSLVIDLLKYLNSSGYKSLIFSNSHLGAELTAFYARRNGINIEVHRAGLLPNHRKRVEDLFKQGVLKALSSTPTLELGIDIGIVDSVVSDLVNVTRLIQRTGRVGRRGQESIAFLALRENDPISQYYKANPEDYFNDVEPGYVDPENPIVAEYQLLAASFDKPILKGEFPSHQKILNSLMAKGLLIESNDKLKPNYPQARKILQKYDIRGCGETISIIYRKKKIGERSMPMAIEELHPEAIYFLNGVRYKSNSFTFNGKFGEAIVEKVPPNYPYYTKALLEEWPTIQRFIERKKVLNMEVAYCELSILKRVIGYVNCEIGSEALKGAKIFLKEPVEYLFNTKGIVFKAPEPRDKLSNTPKEKWDEVIASGFHATEHVIIEGSNMIIGGAGRDMGGISLGTSGLIFIYDSSIGGNGATKALYDRLIPTLNRGYKILVECNCASESGCPRCTYSYRCGNNNEYLNKGAGIEVFRRILDGEQTNLDNVDKLLKIGYKPIV
ncbi:MAG: DEAD/DEAH box helicase [Nitrososphaerales archaeon]